MGSLFREFVTGADSFGKLSSGISNSIISGIMYWMIAGIIMGILFVITGLLMIGAGTSIDVPAYILYGFIHAELDTRSWDIISGLC